MIEPRVSCSFVARALSPLTPLLALLVVACGSDDEKDGQPGATQARAYVVSREVTTGSGTSETAIAVLADTGKQVIEDGTGITVPGYSQAFTELGYVFATNNEDVSLTRYEVSEENELVHPMVLSFASYGSAVGQAYVFSSERAYMTTAGGVLVVWNPSTMEIEDDVELEGLERGGKLGTSITGRDATVAINENARTTGFLNLPIAWSDWDNATVEPVLAILSISTTDATDQKLAVSECSAYSLWVMNGRDDNLYVMGSPAWGPFYHHGEGVPSSAVARFVTSTREFDDGYCQSIPELTGGNQGGIALQYGKGQFLLRAIDEEIAAASGSDTYFGDIASSCSFFQGEISEDGELSLKAAPGMGVDGACFGGFFSVDGDPYFSTPGEDTATFLSRWDGKKLIETIELTGFPQSFERVR